MILAIFCMAVVYLEFDEKQLFQRRYKPAKEKVLQGLKTVSTEALWVGVLLTYGFEIGVDIAVALVYGSTLSYIVGFLVVIGASIKLDMGLRDSNYFRDREALVFNAKTDRPGWFAVIVSWAQLLYVVGAIVAPIILRGGLPFLR